MKLIGLSGYARSGKDTVAEVLVNEYGYERIAFADKLRDFLAALNPIVGYTNTEIILPAATYQLAGPDNIKNWLEFPGGANGRVIPIRLNDVIRRTGWDGYKDTQYGLEIRPLLQRLGTEAGRQVLWDSIWIDAALHGLQPDGKYVVTDCRFPNEAEAITSRGGYTIRINRAGVGPANAHASETSLDNWRFDGVIENDGTLEEFREEIRAFYPW